MNDLIKSMIFEDNTLQHHGVLGMKWGVRRYQPYGEGGYDPKNKGKFVGKRQQKKNAKELQRVSKPFSKKDTRFKIYKAARDTNVAKEYLNSEKYKKELNKYKITAFKRNDLSKKMESYENNFTKMDSKSVKKLNKDLQTAISKNKAQYLKLKKMGESYSKNVLGQYSNKKVPKTYGEVDVEKLLSFALNPIHEDIWKDYYEKENN